MGIKSNCLYCFRAYYSKITYYPSADTFAFNFINEPVLDKFGISGHLSNVFEGWTAVKHSDGNRWWLVLKQKAVKNRCADRFYSVLFDGERLVRLEQSLSGSVICDTTGYPHLEIDFITSGKRFVTALAQEEIVESFYFDRCQGQISLDRVLYNNNNPGRRPYSCEYSKTDKVLYIFLTNSLFGGQPTVKNAIIQYNALDTSDMGTIIWEGPVDISESHIGQSELGPDGKIYLSHYYFSTNANSNYISIIHNPDSLGSASNFELFGLKMDSGFVAQGSLPNFPNYNLGPISIFAADAGPDTLIWCRNSTITELTLGDSIPVPNVDYLWEGPGLNSLIQSFQVVVPDTPTLYYLNLSDTTIQHSCQTRTDSVLVIPQANCPTSTEDISQNSEFRLQTLPKPRYG